jgi:hypothetical protein
VVKPLECLRDITGKRKIESTFVVIPSEVEAKVETTSPVCNEMILRRENVGEMLKTERNRAKDVVEQAWCVFSLDVVMSGEVRDQGIISDASRLR